MTAAETDPLTVVSGPNGILIHLGLRTAPPEEAPAWAEVDVRPDLTNIANCLQGGVVATVIDVAAGITAARAAQSPHILTADMTIRYLAPGRVGPVRATGSVLRLARSAVVVDVRVTDRGDGDRLIATASLSFAISNPAKT